MPLSAILLERCDLLCSRSIRNRHFCKMDPSVLKEKFRVLQSTQDAINATADALIEHSSDARRIVKAWNEVWCTTEAQS